MPPKLSTKPIIPRKALEEIAEARLLEAETLRKAGHYAAAIYLAGFAVECYLKAAICATLHWNELRETFKTHDLESLMLHSGSDSKLRKNSPLVESFAKIRETWALDRPDSIRYRRPADFKKKDAELFMQYVSDPATGIVPWLRKAIS